MHKTYKNYDRLLTSGVVQTTLVVVPTSDDDLLTAREVAAIFRVRETTVSAWGRKGRLPRIQAVPGGIVRFRRTDVEALLTPETTPAA